MIEKELASNVAVVTGGARSIGRVISLELADRGASIVLADKDEMLGGQVYGEIVSKNGNALYVSCDVRKEADVREMVERAVSNFSKIDILVNCAGILGPVAPLWETSSEVWDDVIAVNLRSAYLCAKYVVPYMIRQKFGRIINISSAVGKQAQPMLSPYSVSKAGMIALTVSLAKEVGEHGITVNAVCPGPVETPLWDESRKVYSKIFGIPERDVVNKFTQVTQLIKVPLKPEDISRVVCWLSSYHSNLITGQAIGIDGGQVFPTF